MMNGWTSQSVVGSLKCSSLLLQNDHRLANDVKQWREPYVCNAQCSIPAERLHVKIMSMVFGVESLKKNGMQPGIDSLHLLAFAPFHSDKFSARVGA